MQVISLSLNYIYGTFLVSFFTMFTVIIIVNHKTEKEISLYIGNSLIIYVWNQCFTLGKLSASVPMLIIIIVFALC